MVDETPAATARHLLRAAPRAALGTRLRGTTAPYVSLVALATDHDGAPLLLLSQLAEHTRNLQEDPAAALLVGDEREREDPLAGARVTLLGRVQRSDDPAHRNRFLARHPAAEGYAGFADFGFFRMEVERAHLVAGFGRIHWLAAADVLTAPAPALLEREADILAHMNDEHQDAVQLYARHLLGHDGDGWRLTGIDPLGCDLRCGARTARLGFERRVEDAEDARAELVRLARAARAAQAGGRPAVLP